jgi:hypothetical protein
MKIRFKKVTRLLFVLFVFNLGALNTFALTPQSNNLRIEDSLFDDQQVIDSSPTPSPLPQESNSNTIPPSAIQQQASNSQSQLDQYLKHLTVVPVPEGNRNPTRPALPESTMDRLSKALESLKEGEIVTEEQMIEVKYQRAMKILKRKKIEMPDGTKLGLRQAIMQIAPLFGVEPEQVFAALVGEHTYNVGASDTVQDFLVRQRLLLLFKDKWDNPNRLSDILKLEVFRTNCDGFLNNNYNYWNCVRETWNSKVRGHKIDDTVYSSNEYITEFFDPKGAGKTYGLGQLGPHQILSLTQLVHEKAPDQPLQSIENLEQIYDTCITDASVLHYIAASIAISIQQYKDVANFDISKNAGLLATLYNLGKEKYHAVELFKRNVKNLQKGKPLQYPEENYYGWLINDKYNDIVATFNEIRNSNKP